MPPLCFSIIFNLLWSRAEKILTRFSISPYYYRYTFTEFSNNIYLYLAKIVVIHTLACICTSSDRWNSESNMFCINKAHTTLHNSTLYPIILRKNFFLFGDIPTTSIQNIHWTWHTHLVRCVERAMLFGVWAIDKRMKNSYTMYNVMAQICKCQTFVPWKTNGVGNI